MFWKIIDVKVFHARMVTNTTEWCFPSVADMKLNGGITSNCR